jgi:two-component system chemotaxis response regulator CheY
MKKLLISDSLKPFIEKEKNILKNDDIKIFTASSGKDILDIHILEKVDLIITDLEMPEMDGDKICSLIRKDDNLKNVSFIITCDNDKSAISRCYSSRANAFITKPINSEELFDKLKKFLNVSKRKDIRVIFKVTIQGKVKEKYFYANSENVSMSGILFVTNEILEKGVTITCSFSIGRNLITTNGNVVRVERKSSYNNYYGVQFINLSLPSKAKLENFIEKH